ncbi:hypothetical protein LGH56_34015 [Rhizobium ruizarguesonis]|nr:hypothetical protein [Rhizobium ruizarguesonis]
MQFNDEATLTKPSALPVERRALVDHLREAIARLTHGLAAAGLVEFVPTSAGDQQSSPRYDGRNFPCGFALFR